MQPDSDNSRILAIVIRSRRLGYAVLEDSVRLVDWGMVFYRRNGKEQVAAARKRMAFSLTFFAPSVVVIERPRFQNVRNAAGLCRICRSIRHEASTRGIPLCVMKRDEVRRTFHDFQAKSKDEIAAVLGRMFPEVAPRLPPKRKIWNGEHSIMPMFDAIAVGVSYWERHYELQNQPPE